MFLKKVKRFLFNIKYKGYFRGQDFHHSFICDNYTGLKYGLRCYVGPFCHFDAKGGIVLEDYCIIGPHVKIWSYNHNFKSEVIPYGGDDILKRVVIGKGSWIGIGAIILPGSIIGEGSIIGAGAIVSGIIPPFSIVRPSYAHATPLTVFKNKDLFRRNS